MKKEYIIHLSNIDSFSCTCEMSYFNKELFQYEFVLPYMRYLHILTTNPKYPVTYWFNKKYHYVVFTNE